MKRRFGSSLLTITGLIAAAGAFYLSDVRAADTDCGGQACEETVVCSSSSVVKCSDWNNRSTDAWSVSPYGGGSIKPGVGYRGTAGWEDTISEGNHGTVYFDTPVSGVGHGPFHARFYIKFSPGYLFIPTCGLQKMFYLEAQANTFWRIMLGIAPANWMGGSYQSLPQTVGIFGFDYIGHTVRLPNQPGDNPVLIHPDRWYAVEIMAHWTSRTQNVVKIWVDGQLQMTRSNHDDGVWTTAHTFNRVQDSSHYGGNHPDCLPVQTQYVYKDNHVLSKSYIGIIGTADNTPPAIPAGVTVK